MEKLNVQFASKTVEFSEYKTYYEVSNRVCYYDYPNGNNVVLPYDDTSLEKAQTLVDMPVQAKYTVNADGLPDLLDHCVTVDENGNYQFNTVSVGVHTAVEIKDDTIETFDGKTMTLPCLFAKAKIWKRYGNYCAAIKRLYDEGSLNNSWEISSFSYEYKDGVKTLGDYVFEGNAYLGEDVLAAYRDASKVLELSNENKRTELLVASALSADLLVQVDTSSDINATRKEEDILNKTKNNKTEKNDSTQAKTEPVVDEPIKENSEENPIAENAGKEIEKSSLTSWDLQRKISQACRNKLDEWCYVAMWFPTENTVWVKADRCEQELDYLLFSYTVEGESVNVSEPTDVKLTVSVASINNVISEKNDALIAANTKIQELSSQIETLSPFKEAYEKAEFEKAEAEKKAKIENMKKDAIDSDCFSAEELEGEELAALFDSANDEGLKLLIADRVLNKLRQEQTSEVATTETTSKVKADLTNDEPTTDYLKEVKKFLK